MLIVVRILDNINESKSVKKCLFFLHMLWPTFRNYYKSLFILICKDIGLIIAKLKILKVQYSFCHKYYGKIMINRYITAAILVTTLLCSHRANAELIRVSDGETVNDLASESTTVWDIDDNGKLKGAFNVAVAGTLWDVVFQDGTFGSVFPDSAAIDIRTLDEALEFTTALESGVFVDIATLEFMFDSKPELTNGCSEIHECLILTSYGIAEGAPGDRERKVGFFGNFFLEGGDRVRSRLFPTEKDVSIDERVVYAQWNKQHITEVPSPSTISIFALGIMGLASRRFKKQS